MRLQVNLIQSFFAFSLLFTGTFVHAATVTGQLEKWYPVNVDFVGPLLDETSDSPNPFLDYRLNVTFTSPLGSRVVVPGFFAGNGQGAGRGNIWRARFSPDEVGQWSYSASLKNADEIAVSLDENAGSDVQLEGATGRFTISAVSAAAPEFLQSGRLEYVGEHYLKFRDGSYWIKGGTDSPENILGFAGIDNTVDQGGNEINFLHEYNEHRSDWVNGDPLFTSATSGVDSRGIIGALNYLGDQGVNSIYFLPMNLGGDGQDTYPFVDAANTRYNKTHYDISKLHQWDMILNHAQNSGIALNIVLSETEDANERWLDNGELGVERKLFFRELVARFGYLLAVKWNLGEENDFPLVELQKHADFIQALDWSNKPIAVHTHINQFFRYGELVGDSRFSATSIQYDPEFAGQFVEQWRNNSDDAGRRWVLDMDENTNGLGSDGIDRRRKEILYDVFFSGGNIEWYFGSQPLPLGGDTTAENFRLREDMWQQMRYAREMMQRELPFWRMVPADNLVSGDSGDYGGAEVFALSGEVYAVYLPRTNGTETIDISAADSLFTQRWFNPRTGVMTEGRNNLASSGSLSLGTPPSELGEDWVTLITSAGSNGGITSAPIVENEAPVFTAVPSPTVRVGETYSVTLTAIDSDGTYPVVTARQVPGGMQLFAPGNGRLVLRWDVPPDASEQSIVQLITRDAIDQSKQTEQTMTITVIGTDAQTDNEQNNISGDNGSGPVFPEVPDLSVRRGDQLTVRLEAIDDSGLAPSVTVDQIPRGMRVNGPGNGVLELQWRVPDDAMAESVVELIAIDPVDASNRTSQRMIIRVLDGMGSTVSGPTASNVPVLRAVDASQVSVGQSVSIRIVADDADGIPPGLILLNAPEGSSFDDNGDGTRTFRWSPTSAQTGTYVLSVLARDHSDASKTDTMDVDIEVLP